MFDLNYEVSSSASSTPQLFWVNSSSRKLSVLPQVSSLLTVPYLSVVARGSSHIEGKWSYELLIVLQFAFVGKGIIHGPRCSMSKQFTDYFRFSSLAVSIFP